jgi:putative sterol carrier protein
VSRDALKSSIESKLKSAPPLGYIVEIDMDDEGKIYLNDDNSVSDTTDKTPDTTLTISLDNMKKIVSGETDPNMAALTGKMKVSGKMGVALKLASYLE